MGSGGSGGGSSGGRKLADAAQPEIKETINSIQTKLDQLDNRTQASLLLTSGLAAYELIPRAALHGWAKPTSRQPLCPHYQAHDKTLVSINNHLVNGKGTQSGGATPGGGGGGEGRLQVLKEEILRELESRVSLSCSSCQVTAAAAHHQSRISHRVAPT